MAISMDALLKIKADVQGEGAIQSLATGLGKLNGAATTAGKGFSGLANAAGGLVSGFQSLVPLATGAGLIALGKSAIDAADDMNDLSQKTGVSVEELSKFQQAAGKSGTTLDAVGGAMLKFNKALATGKAADELRKLGISATDANGKLKGTDTLMYEIANAFAKMPDGANKSAIAMALFGKSGADMIPMLNGGAESIRGLSATMSSDFASKADQFNDKLVTLQTAMAKIGVAIGTALLPVINAVTDGLVGFASAFSALPGPVQTILGVIGGLIIALGVLAPAISSIITIAGALGGLQIGATIAGWAGIIGPAVTAITAALGGLLAWITGTLLPGLLAVFSGPVGWTVLAVAAVVAMVILFREPIMQFLGWLWEQFQAAATTLGQFLYAWYVQPWVTLWDAIKPYVTAFLTWVQDAITWAVQAWMAILYQMFIQPFINLWELIKEPVINAIKWLNEIWNGVGKAFNTYVVIPISKAWNALASALPNAMKKAAEFFKSIWTGAITTVKNIFRGWLLAVASGINGVVRAVNYLISRFNALPGPDIPLLGYVTVPAFAEGGYVKQPTVGLVGEAGDEYIIPSGKMAEASRRFLSGARGADVIPTNSGGGRSTGGGGAPVINITTGPVMEFNGERYVTVRDFERGMRMTAEGVIGRLRTPAARIALGTI